MVQGGPVVVTQEPPSHSNRFLCCCSGCRCCCHVRRGIIGVIVIELLALAAGVATLLFLFFSAGGFDVWKDPSAGQNVRFFGYSALAAIITFVAFLIAIILTCIGLRKDRPLLLIPHMVLQVS